MPPWDIGKIIDNISMAYLFIYYLIYPKRKYKRTREKTSAKHRQFWRQDNSPERTIKCVGGYIVGNFWFIKTIVTLDYNMQYKTKLNL